MMTDLTEATELQLPFAGSSRQWDQNNPANQMYCCFNANNELVGYAVDPSGHVMNPVYCTSSTNADPSLRAPNPFEQDSQLIVEPTNEEFCQNRELFLLGRVMEGITANDAENLLLQDGQGSLHTDSQNTENLLENLLGNPGEGPFVSDLMSQSSFCKYLDSETLDNLTAVQGTSASAAALPYGTEGAGRAQQGHVANPYGSEAVCFIEYPGPFNLQVEPVMGNSKIVFQKDRRKLFANLGTYEFSVKLDFDLIADISEYCLRAALFYKDPTFQDVPVMKCINCMQAYQKTLDEDDRVGANMPNLVDYIMRGPLTETSFMYEKSKTTGHLYTFMKLGQPEPGTRNCRKHLTFTCRSSCRTTADGSHGINRRDVAIVFSLLDGSKRICGRSVINMRICSAPSRDAKAELLKEQNVEQGKPATQKGGRKRKDVSASPAASTAPKHPRREGAQTANRDETEYDSPLMDLPEDRAAAKAALVGSQDSYSSSQDSVIEGEVASFQVRKIIAECKKVLAWVKSDNRVQRGAAMQLYDCLKAAGKVCRRSREIILSAYEDPKDEKN